MLCVRLTKEWFAKDTSRKVKTALHVKFAEGQRTFTYAPLGYIRHPEIKNALVVDSETKWIVEKIFDLAVHGAGAAKITKILTAEKVPPAGHLNFKRYGTFANIYAGAPEVEGGLRRWGVFPLCARRLRKFKARLIDKSPGAEYA